MNGPDPRKINWEFRCRGLEVIRNRMQQSAKQANHPVDPDKLNLFAKKIEAQIFEKAASKLDYIKRIQSEQADVNRQSPAVSTSGNQLESTVIQCSAQQANMISANRQPAWMLKPPPLSSIQSNLFIQNHQTGQQNQQFLQQNDGQMNQPFGQQNQQFLQQNDGQMNQPFGQQNQQFLQQNDGQMNQPFGQQNQQFLQQNGGQMNQPFGQQNQQFLQQNGGQMNQPFGQQNQQFLQQNDGQMNQPFGQQNQQFLQQNGGQMNQSFGQQNQQLRQVDEQFGQQNFIQNENINQASQALNSPPLENPQAHRNQVTQVSNASVPPENSGVKINHVPSESQPQGTSGGAPGSTSTKEFQFLIDKLHGLQSICMPELNKLHENCRLHFNQVQNESEFEIHNKLAIYIKETTRMLSIQDNQFKQLGKEKALNFLKEVIKRYNRLLKEPSQYLALLDRTAGTSVTLNTQSVPAPIVSSSTVNPGYSLPHAPIISVESTMLHSVSQGSAEQNTTRLNLKSDQQMQQPVNLLEKGKYPMNSTSQPNANSTASNLPETGNDFMSLMYKLATNGVRQQQEKSTEPFDPTMKTVTKSTGRVSTKPLLKPGLKSSGTSQDSWLELAGFRSKKQPLASKLSGRYSANDQENKDTRSVLEPRPAVLSKDSRPTVVAPSSVPKEHRKTSTVTKVTSLQELMNVEPPAPLLKAPEIVLGSAVAPNITQRNPEKRPIDQLLDEQNPEKRPIDRLVDTVSSVSKKALVSGVADMRLAVNTMDSLPAYAYLDDNNPLELDDDLREILEWLFCESDDPTNIKYQESEPNKKRKHEFESVSRAVRPFKIDQPVHVNQTLLDEIDEANRKLFGTIVRIVTCPSNESSDTLVRCTYSPVTVAADILRSIFGTQSINLSIEFVVPNNYPIGSAKVHGCKLADFGVEIELAKNAKILFDTQVRGVDPLRIGGMATVWDDCARSSIASYAEQVGGRLPVRYNAGWERFQPGP